ncbi:porin [Neptuniibacter halophilus]|uniref:porin n=1 Tax=Neptuniibacter halophilus TaxID=651666 RepID=UPI0025747B4D|nr:porin [Neptuniibacter halophilus]
MKNNKAKLLAVAVAMGISTQASAAIELYNQDGTTFSADGHFNAFYVHTDNDANNEEQSRVRMGFLPNYIGFNVGKEVDGLKLGGRSSFWVTINDGNNEATDTAIDVRQFYGTIDADFGQVLFGKDFGLYARSNIFSDELLLGTGLPTINNDEVTLGNISIGYPYAQPRAQITYRTPVNNGFQLAVGIIDPQSGETTQANTDNSARFEGELTYATDFDGGKFNAWIGGAVGENDAADVDSSGVAYGARVSVGGFQFTASGFDQEGISTVFAGNNLATEADSDGYLIQAAYQAGDHRFILSHGETDTDTTSDEMQSIAYFYNVNSNLKLIAEYDIADSQTLGQDTKQFAIGAALSW